MCLNFSQKIYIYKTANFTEIKKDLNEISSTINVMYSQSNSTEDLWNHFEKSLQETLDKNIPTKMTGNKFSSPWITYEIKKLTRIRDRTHKKMKKSNCPRLKKVIKDLNRKIQQKVRRSHWDYVNSLFAKHVDDIDPHEKNKRFWSYIQGCIFS